MDHGEVDPTLDVTKANRKLWLVKVPRNVAAKWRAACEQSMNVTGTEDPALGAELGQHDRQETYNLRNSVEDISQLVAFSIPTPGSAGTPRVEGSIVYKLDAAITNLTFLTAQGDMVIDEKYRELNKKRNDAAAVKTRTVQLVSDKDSYMRMGGPLQQLGKRKVQEVEARISNKRERMEKGELEAMLFGLFERQPHWNFQQLQKETNQPAPWLKEVVNGLARLSKAGPWKGFYELRPEYKTSNAATTVQ